MNIFVIDGVTYVGDDNSTPEHRLFEKIMGRTQTFAVTSANETTFHKTTSGDYVLKQDVIDVLLENGYTVHRPIVLKVQN